MNRYIIILTNFYSQRFLVSCLLSHIVRSIPSRERKISRFTASLKRSEDIAFSSSLAWIQFAIENSCVGSCCWLLTTLLLFFLAPWVGGMAEELELPFTARLLDLDLSTCSLHSLNACWYFWLKHVRNEVFRSITFNVMNLVSFAI